MKPPTFIECSVCGREFGSKSIQIHEPQCLQKLRRTEIPPSDPHQSKPRRKKKLSPPFTHNGSSQQESNSAPLPTSYNNPFCSEQQQSFLVSMDSRKISLPKITPAEGRYAKGRGEPNSRSIARPSTATLTKPKILNIDYIQYDMSLTRIDFSSSSHSPSPVQGQNIMDENHNHKTTHRLTRQNTSVIDPANRSPFILPAVSPTNLRSVLPTKLYKGIDVGPTKLPSSNVVINSILGDPLKRTNAGCGGGNENFLSRQSGKLSIKADDKCLPSRNFVPSSSSSFWSSGIFLMNMQLQSTHNQSFIPDLPCYIPADDFHLESPVSYVTPSCPISKSISFPYLHSISSSQCLIKNDDTLLEKIPQIKPRTSCQPDQEISYVTSALAAANCKLNDSKVQDQSQAQGKCCGGHSSTCDSQQTHLAPSLQSFQANQEEMFQIEGAALSQKQFFEKLEQHSSSQEIIFLKTRKGYQNWSSDANIPLEGIQQNNDTDDQYEFHQIFMGHMQCSNSAQSFSSIPNEMPKIIETENTKPLRDYASSAEEESVPTAGSPIYIYEDDFEQESQPESCHDIPKIFETKRKGEIDPFQSVYTQERESVHNVLPMVDIIRNVTEKLPPLYSKGDGPLLRKELQTDFDSQEKRNSYETKLAACFRPQGSGSEGDDEEESDSMDYSAVKWTSNWTLIENKPTVKPQRVCKAKDSIEHLKSIKKYEKNEKAVTSGRKLWNKNIGKDLDIATDFGDILIKETSVSCANKSDKKFIRNSDKQLNSTKSDTKLPDVVEYNNEPEDVVWEGSQCQRGNIASENVIEGNYLQQSVPPRSRRNSSHTTKLPPNSRRNSRDTNSKKQSENFLQYNKEQQAVSDLVSAVYRLKRLQKNKILEDYLMERPMTQGSWGYNRLGPPFAQIEIQRPHSSPSSFNTEKVVEKEPGSFNTKPKISNRPKKDTLSSEVVNSIKLLENSLLSSFRVEDKHKKVINTRRPRTPITNKPNKAQTITESAIRRLEQIARVYNVKPPLSAIATQTPRKGERLLTPTKDRKPATAKVSMATQTITRTVPPKSALKKSVAYDFGKRRSISGKTEEIPTISLKKKDISGIQTIPKKKATIECQLQNSEIRNSKEKQIFADETKYPEKGGGNILKHTRRKRIVNKISETNSNDQLHHDSKKGSLHNKRGHPELPIFHSEQPSKSHIRVKRENDMISDDSFNSSSEFSHYEGCRKKDKSFSHELNVVADQDVDICYRIFPPSFAAEKKSSHEKGEDRRGDTVIRLSARRIESRDSSKALRKKSNHKELSSNQSGHSSKLKIKSYSNIELMVPHSTSSAAEQDFIDLNIVVRRKSELGFYPSLEETKSGVDDGTMLLLLDEEEEHSDSKKISSKLEPTPSTSTKYEDGTWWKQQYDVDFYSPPTEEISRKVSCKDNEQRPFKYYGQEYTEVELKKYQSNNSNKVDQITSVDKVPKILYKRVSRAVCQGVSSDALIMFENKEPVKPSPNEVESIIKEVYEKSGYKVSEHQALQLINSQNMLNEFLNDYVPKKDRQLDTLVEGIRTALRFFGLLPENHQWAGYFTDEKEAQ